MKKISLYYFIMIGCVNIWFAYSIPLFEDMVLFTYHRLIGETPLPYLTNMALGLTTWPYFFIVLSVLGIILVARGVIQEKTAFIIMTNILLIEMFIFYLLMIAYFSPTLNYRVSSVLGEGPPPVGEPRLPTGERGVGEPRIPDDEAKPTPEGTKKLEE